MTKTASYFGAAFALAITAAASVAGCGTPRTQIMVVADTDFTVPSELDEIVFEVTGPAGRLQTSTAALQPGVAAYVAVVHEGGALSPLEVVVSGRRGGAIVVERRARAAWLPERTVVLQMNLLRGCDGVSCAAEQTCGEAGCRSVEVDPSELRDWTGTPPRIDAGADSGTDGAVDSAVDSSFDTGGGDTGAPDTGPVDAGPCPACDTTRDPSNCGALEMACADDEYCVTSACGCRPGLTDNAGTCIDLQNDPMNCGTIGNACANQCREGSCRNNCGPDANCSDACIDLASDPLNCGACGTRCATGQVCANRACRDFVVRSDCTICPCATCPSGLNCCTYPGSSDAICVDGPCP